MASRSLSRLALRQSRFLLQRRAASTTSEATQAASKGATAAKETAQNTVSKAQEGLSKVTSSAGPVLSKAASSVQAAANNATGRTAGAISWVQSVIPHVVYYGRVAGELGKTIYNGRNFQPPSLQTVQSYLQPVTKAIRNPSTFGSQTAKAAERTADTAINNPETFLTRLRNLDHATLTSVGIVTAETIGFFTVGEMLGRFKIIGYRSNAVHHEH